MKKPMAEIYMKWAWDLSKQSSCGRLKVGALVTTTNLRQVLAIGYNGGPKGLYNECLSDQPGQCGHLHAEDNACNYAPAEIPKIMFVTHAPCLNCAIRMVNKGGFEKLYFSEYYRDSRGIDLLTKAGIGVDLITERK